VCPDGVAMRLILFYGQSPLGGTYSDGVTIAQYKANLRCMAERQPNNQVRQDGPIDTYFNST